MTISRALLCVSLLLSLSACATRKPPTAPSAAPLRVRAPLLARIRYSVQVGAFANQDNAIRLIESLAERGLEAFYFAGEDGLHRVRFGSFASKDIAARRAEALRGDQIIGAYYVLPPEPIAPAANDPALRDEIVHSAKGFLGRPYRWGGPSAETGFDCSGLTMTAYRLSGLALPRTSMAQYAAGSPLPREELQPADLVFFSTARSGQPTHVGLYVGDGRFIHAPRRGDVVRIDPLSGTYYDRHFLGARSYLR